MRHNRRDSAVSPVIGILLMLVITIIIAAVVSGFAGSFVQGQNRVPQALITGSFSVSDGFTIQHKSGDSVPTADMVITIQNSRDFGTDAEFRSIQVVNQSLIRDLASEILWISDGNPFVYNGVTMPARPEGSRLVTGFSSGDKALIPADNCDCDKLQPLIVPSGYTSGDDYSYTGSDGELCLRSASNIGKTFIMHISDRATGKLISTSTVTITP